MKTHGHAPRDYHKRHPRYTGYKTMLSKCRNPNHPDYRLYGARGIQVCQRWQTGDGTLTGFECFLADMGERPPGTTLDRVDNSKGYSPENCRWATARQQGRNTRWVKLTEEKVAEIKAAILRGARNKELSEQYGVVSSAISNIKSGVNWAGVEPKR